MAAGRRLRSGIVRAVCCIRGGKGASCGRRRRFLYRYAPAHIHAYAGATSPAVFPQLPPTIYAYVCNASPQPQPLPPPTPQNKRHPSFRALRNFAPPPGRIRVQLKRPDGTPCIPGIATKLQLMAAVARVLPSHPQRLNRIMEIQRQSAAMEAQRAAAMKSNPPPGVPKVKDAEKKKGKKK